MQCVPARCWSVKKLTGATCHRPPVWAVLPRKELPMSNVRNAPRSVPPAPQAIPAQAPDTSDARDILRRLAEVFDPRELSYKCQAVSKDRTRALACWYLDPRAVMDRLDMVMGTAWQDEYEVYDDGTVICKLSLWINSRIVVRSDVGGPNGSEIDKDGNVDATMAKKTAVSDSLKRAAVRFGIGRYVYQLDSQWCDWDDQRGEFKTAPRLPDWALPSGDGQTREREPGEDDPEPPVDAATLAKLERVIAL